MKCLFVEPMQHPTIIEIDGALRSLQDAVGGSIQVIYPFDDPVAIICNDEGKILNLCPNRELRDEDGLIYDIIFGNFLVVGIADDSFCDLNRELLEKYMGMYWNAKIFEYDSSGNAVVLEIIELGGDYHANHD